MHSSRIIRPALFALEIFLLSQLFSSCKKAESKPWAGIVSHHELAHDYIENFFEKLEESRSVSTFIVICPSHYNLSTQKWSVADYVWKLEDGKTVPSNSKKAFELKERLGVDFDNQVFYVEHGVLTLIPYIKNHFPHADVVAVAVDTYPPMNQPKAEALYKAIAPFFEGNGRNENFLLISSDFSHHGDIEHTKEKDEISRKFFENPSRDNFIYLGCDNQPGMYVMSGFCTSKTKAEVLGHTTSFDLSGGEDPDDITSYFFVLMRD